MSCAEAATSMVAWKRMQPTVRGQPDSRREHEQLDGYRRLTNGPLPDGLVGSSCCAGQPDQAEREAQSWLVGPRSDRPGRPAAFQRLAMVAEFEAGLIRIRTRED